MNKVVLIFCCAATCCLGFDNRALAQQIVINLVVKDAKFEKPRFEAPVSATYELRESNSRPNFELPILNFTSGVGQKVSDGFSFGDWPIEQKTAARRYAFFEFDGDEVSEFIPVNPFQQWLYLSDDIIDLEQKITQVITLDKRSSISLSYKRQVNEQTRIPNPTKNQILSAFSAANSAVGVEPTVDNFLLNAKVLKFALDTDMDVSGAPLGVPQLQAMPGFDNLGIGDQWIIETEILDVLTSSDKLDKKIGPTQRVLDAAVQLGKDMLDQIDYSNPEETSLRIVRVFQAMSYLYSKDQDCLALGENNSEAIEKSEAIQMNWASQRVLMSDWADCLEKMTGFGLGLDQEALADSVSEKPLLLKEWERFLAAGKVIQPRLELATDNSAERIRNLLEFATLATKR